MEKVKEMPQTETNGEVSEEEKMRQIAFQREMMMRAANLIMQALSVGGEQVNPLFDKGQRGILEEKLYGFLKVL
tara:strand:+ start:698 stop:919 length:222 start_codon:yes stop_codon:yes gene_type:complete